MGDVMRQMPQYMSHKKVWALQIKAVDGYRLSFVDEGFADREVPPEMFARYTPVPGDYFVQYAGDGYLSISPQMAFEEGYSRLP